MEILIILVSIIVVFLLVNSFSKSSKEKHFEKHIKEEKKEDKKDAIKQKGLIKYMISKLIKSLGEKISNSNWEVLKERIKKINIKINKAGDYYKKTPGEFLATQILLIISVFILFPILFTKSVAIIFVFALFASMIPEIYLKDAIKKNHKAITNDLPYVLDLMTLLIESGLDFSSALNKIIERSENSSLIKEFKRMQNEVRVGKSRTDALRDMADRLQHMSLDSVVNTIIQSIKLGSSIGPIIRKQSIQLRKKRFQRAEKIAGEAPIKMLFPMIIFIFPTIFIVIFGPVVIKFIMSGGF